jgi:hypothetical protein
MLLLQIVKIGFLNVPGFASLGTVAIVGGMDFAEGDLEVVAAVAAGSRNSLHWADLGMC